MKTLLVQALVVLVLSADAAIAAGPSTKQECEAAGGNWGRWGLLVEERCNLPTRDAGKSCSDSSQCQSACVANMPVEKFKRRAVCSGPKYQGKPCDSVADCGGSEVCIIEFESIRGTGSCYGWTILVGTCLNRVKGGFISSPLCVD